MLVIENGQVPVPLASAIRGRGCAVFIGSGLSLANYHSWPELVNALCEACGVARRVTRESPESEFLDAAEAAKSADPQAYFALLGAHFGRPVESIPTIYHVLLSLPFDCYMTVNFDPLLATGAQHARQPCKLPVNAYPTLDRKKAGGRSVHHLHGFIRQGHTPVDGEIVLANGEFQEAYSANSNLMNFLVPTIENEPILFVGCRLREPTMKQVFDICKQHQLKRQQLIAQVGAPPSEAPFRFITLQAPHVRDAAGVHDEGRSAHEQQKLQQYYEKLGITPVWYDGQENDHAALLRALENLADLPRVEPQHGWEGPIHDH